MTHIDLEFCRQRIVQGIRDYAHRYGFTGVVAGCSGGIDSALTLALAVEALGPDNVVAITMPSRFSSPGSVSDSQALCRNLGVVLHTHPIQDIVTNYQQGFEHAFATPLQDLPLENLQARVRGTLLMAFSNRFGHLLLATGNKSEILVGYCTLYGDTNGGLAPLGDLYKTEVFALTDHINETAGWEIIPQAIRVKPPSAELAPNQKDTDSLPYYEVLDDILKLHVEGVRLPEDQFAAVSASVKKYTATIEGSVVVSRIQALVARNEFKRRQMAPVIELRGPVFGANLQI
jgi:NAD+ synthase (glutamine-hydrolysing)